MNVALLPVVAALLVAGPPEQDSAAAQGNPKLLLPSCEVAAITEVNVPALEAGLLREIKVKEGAHVKPGELLALLDDTDAKLAADAARIEERIAQKQADSEVEVLATEKQHEVASLEYEDAQRINERAPGTISTSQQRREELTAMRAKYQHEAALEQQEINKETHALKTVQRKAAERRHEKHKVHAIKDGVILQILRRPGEWVQVGDPILRTVQMQTLRVEGFVSVRRFAPYEIMGRRVTISVKLSRDQIKEIDARIDYVSPLIQANGDYRVWAEVKNTAVGDSWLIAPGMDASMTIHVDQPAIAAPQKPAANVPPANTPPANTPPAKEPPAAPAAKPAT